MQTRVSFPMPDIWCIIFQFCIFTATDKIAGTNNTIATTEVGIKMYH